MKSFLRIIWWADYDGDRSVLAVEHIREAFPDMYYDVQHVVIDREMEAVH